MKEFWLIVQGILAALGGWIGWYVGGCDGLMYALVVCVVVDYVTGVMCAVADRKLSSAVGFRGICRKVLIFLLVGLGHAVDVYVIGAGAVLRTAVIFFYISNEGVSLLENASRLGLPVPGRLKKVLVMLHDKAEEEDSGEALGAGKMDGSEAGIPGTGLPEMAAERVDAAFLEMSRGLNVPEALNWEIPEDLPGGDPEVTGAFVFEDDGLMASSVEAD